MRLAYDLALIFGIDGGSTFAEYLTVTVMIGLTAATDTSTRTGHDLNGMIVRMTAPHIVQQFAGVTQPMRNPNIEHKSTKIDRGGAYTLHAT